MISEEEFLSWLNDDAKKDPLLTNEKIYQVIYLKVPKSEQFVYLYAQSCYDGKGIERNSSFSYAGFYNKANKMIYDSGPRFEKICPKHVFKNPISNIYTGFEDEVRKVIEQTVEQNLEYYQKLDLSEEREKSIRYFEDHCLSQAVRKLYLAGVNSDEITMDVNYILAKRNEELLLGIIANPKQYIKSEAEKYLSESEEDILYELKTTALKKSAIQALEGEDDGQLQRIKRIMEAVENSGAQTVKVTVNKDGEEFTFKTSTNDLRIDPFKYYSSYNIAVEDRKIFEKKFGRCANYTPEEIVEITYRGKPIYFAEPYEAEQSETSGMVIGQG